MAQEIYETLNGMGLEFDQSTFIYIVFPCCRELFPMFQRIIKTKDGKGKDEDPNSFHLITSFVQLLSL